MIPIRNRNISVLASKHTKCILEYYKSRRSVELSVINKFIDSVWGANYSFDTLLTAKPDDLLVIVNRYDSAKCTIPVEVDRIKSAYNNFSSGTKSSYRDSVGNQYNALTFVQSLNISVCPYCNRNYIYSLPISKRRTSQLDHFYSKDKYPFLALSFYNLVPSCGVCNHLKGNSAGNYYNPYDVKVSASLLRFKAVVKGANFLFDKNDIGLQNSFNSAFEANYRNLKLEELYDNHLDLVQEIFKKGYIYNTSYLDSLFKKYEGKLFKTRDELTSLILSNYISDEDLHIRPFSKLTMDIWRQIQSSSTLPEI